MIFDDVHDLFRYKFCHLFLMSVGIVFDYISVPLWIKLHALDKKVWDEYKIK